MQAIYFQVFYIQKLLIYIKSDINTWNYFDIIVAESILKVKERNYCKKPLCTCCYKKPVNRGMLLWQWRESGNCNNVSMSNHNDACSVPYPDLNDKRCFKIFFISYKIKVTNTSNVPNLYCTLILPLNTILWWYKMIVPNLLCTH